MPVIIAIVAVVLVLGGVVYYNQSRTGEDKMVQEEAMMEQKAMEEKEAMEQKEKDVMMEKEGDTMMKKEEGTMMEDGGDVGTMSSAGVSYYGDVLAENGNGVFLLDFNQTDYENAIMNEKLVVLYFYANWCPICKAEFPIMKKAFNELNTDKVIGFRVNYNDDETDNDEKNLAKQFGVAYQHTKVFVKNSQRILKSPEGWDKQRYDTEINKALTQ